MSSINKYESSMCNENRNIIIYYDISISAKKDYSSVIIDSSNVNGV